MQSDHGYQPIDIGIPAGVETLFADMPVIGYYARERRRISHLMQQRRPSMMDLWPKEPQLLEALALVSPLVQEYGGWPNTIYLPADRCDALLWPYGLHSAITELHMKLIVDCGMASTVVESWEGRSFGDWVSGLAAAGWTERKPGKKATGPPDRS